jgi:thioredoxin-related protein
MKKSIKILLLCLFSPSMLFAQMHFEQGLTWQQIKDKAKKENKYIFLDCYATWCGPCKLMDQSVYSDTTVGKIINPLFISMKVQMDSAKNDNETTRSWYPDAHQLMYDYQVAQFPSLLYFSPGGKLLHKSIGFSKPVDFLRQCFNATDPKQQEYANLEKFRMGKLPDAAIPELIAALGRAADQGAATEVAEKYIRNYLLKLPEELLFKSANINLLGKYLKSSQDKIFELFYKQQGAVDRATSKGNADNLIASVITREEIYTKLWSDAQKKNRLTDKPDWRAIYDRIEKKYTNHYAEETVTDAKIEWYRQTSEWPELISAEIQMIETSALDSTGHLRSSWANTVNTINYEDIFKHSKDKSFLTKAAIWAKMIVDNKPDEPDYIDTYANLLYKAGEKKQAIQWETKATELKLLWYKKIEREGDRYPGRLKAKRAELYEMTGTLQKMKMGKATWPDK